VLLERDTPCKFRRACASHVIEIEMIAAA